MTYALRRRATGVVWGFDLMHSRQNISADQMKQRDASNKLRGSIEIRV